jgi:hypothetical protein
MAVWPRRRLPNVGNQRDWTKRKYAMWARGKKFQAQTASMKYAANRPYADADKAARRILEIANAVELTAAARPSTARA